MQLYIGGLSDNTTEDEVGTLFSKIGIVESVRIIRAIGSGKSKGLAIVRMPNNTEGEEAFPCEALLAGATSLRKILMKLFRCI